MGHGVTEGGIFGHVYGRMWSSVGTLATSLGKRLPAITRSTTFSQLRLAKLAKNPSTHPPEKQGYMQQQAAGMYHNDHSSTIASYRLHVMCMNTCMHMYMYMCIYGQCSHQTVQEGKTHHQKIIISIYRIKLIILSSDALKVFSLYYGQRSFLDKGEFNQAHNRGPIPFKNSS